MVSIFCLVTPPPECSHVCGIIIRQNTLATIHLFLEAHVLSFSCFVLVQNYNKISFSLNIALCIYQYNNLMLPICSSTCYHIHLGRFEESFRLLSWWCVYATPVTFRVPSSNIKSLTEPSIELPSKYLALCRSISRTQKQLVVLA